MLDIKLIKENPEDVIARLAAKGRDAKDDIAEIIKLDEERRALIAESENLKAEQNRQTKLVPQMKKEGKDTTDVFAAMKELGAKAKESAAKRDTMSLCSVSPIFPTATSNPAEKKTTSLSNTSENLIISILSRKIT